MPFSNRRSRFRSPEPTAWSTCTWKILARPEYLPTNDRQVAEVSDPLTPAEFDLTPFIREGANDFKPLMRNDNPARHLDAAAPVVRKSFGKQLPLLPEQTLDRRFRNRLAPDSLGRDFNVSTLKS